MPVFCRSVFLFGASFGACILKRSEQLFETCVQVKAVSLMHRRQNEADEPLRDTTDVNECIWHQITLH